jgi:alpha-galactosidase
VYKRQAGLLGHQRAYLAWLDQVFARWPDLVIENCGSGGLRMDYALLQRHSLQSTSDQTDWRKMAAISAAVHTAVTPEQAASWAYPLATDSVDAVAANMVTVLLSRILLSGQLDRLPAETQSVVAEGIAWYKAHRALIPLATPIWPLGIPHIGDGWFCHGLQVDTKKILLAVWRIDGREDTITVPLPTWQGRMITATFGYPVATAGSLRWNAPTGNLAIRLIRQQCACVIEMTME